MPVDCSEPDAFASVATPCVERQLLGAGTTYVHALTVAEVERCRLVANAMAGQKPGDTPVPTAMRIALLVAACRTGEGSQERSFRVEAGRERQAYQTLAAALPEALLEAVVREVEALALAGYYPGERAGTRPGAARQARQNLVDLSTDPLAWSGLQYATLRLWGVDIGAIDQPVGRVLTIIERDMEFREGLLSATGALAAAAGVV